MDWQARKKRSKTKSRPDASNSVLINHSPTDSRSENFKQEINASAYPTDDLTFGLSSWFGKTKRNKVGKEYNGVERNNEMEQSESTSHLACSHSDNLLSQHCLKEESEVNNDVQGVGLPVDGSEAEGQCRMHNLAENVDLCQDLEARCSRPSSTTLDVSSTAESDGKSVSKVGNNRDVISTETYDIHEGFANVSSNSKFLITYERRKQAETNSRQLKNDSVSPAANSKSIQEDINSLLLGVQNKVESTSFNPAIETPSSVCYEDTSDQVLDAGSGSLMQVVEDALLKDVEYECASADETGDDSRKCSTDEALDKQSQLAKEGTVPSSAEVCASRDEAAQANSDMGFLSRERSLSTSSRKKLLVLDMNGLLANIATNVPYKYKPDTVISSKAVFKRPFCNDFLQFCFAQFNVGIWSSRTKRNVELILDFLMGHDKHKLLFCWDQSHCTQTGFTTVENREKPLLLKKLEKLWKKYQPDLPWERGEYNESNTLLLDDSPHKALCNPPHTAIFPQSYTYKDEKDNSLGPGGDLRIYLEGLAMAENVQKYVKENPFGQRPITERNVSWRYYQRVIEACSSSSSEDTHNRYTHDRHTPSYNLDRYTPNNRYAPDRYTSPNRYAPGRYTPPNRYAPDRYTPPNRYASNSYAPDGYTPNNRSAPNSYAPDGYAPNNRYAPNSYAPDGYAPNNRYAPNRYTLDRHIPHIDIQHFPGEQIGKRP